MTGKRDLFFFALYAASLRKIRRIAHDLIPKTLTLIYPKISKNADTFVLKCKKCGKHFLNVEKLVVYNEDGSMTEEAKAMYNTTNAERSQRIEKISGLDFSAMLEVTICCDYI